MALLHQKDQSPTEQDDADAEDDTDDAAEGISPRNETVSQLDH